MFLITFIFEKDFLVLLFYFLYSFTLFYAVGNLLTKYYKFERYNFFFKFNLGFIVVFSFNFLFYVFLSILTISASIIIIFEKMKEFFVLFFLIFSFKNWINLNQKYNYFFYKKVTVTMFSIALIISIFYFSEKNLEWFNSFQRLSTTHDFYQYYYHGMNLKIDIMEVSENIYLNYYVMFAFAILIYFAIKSVISQTNKNYFATEILVLILSIFFILLLNLNSVSSEYYFAIYLFFYSTFLLYRKESYKSKTELFNQLILISIFLTFSATNWGIFYFLAFSITLILYSLYKEEDIYRVFSIFMFLVFVQLFLYIYEISFIYGLVFLGLSLLIFYYPITSLFKWERSTELLEFEENLRKNQKKFVYSILLFFGALNIFFIFWNANIYFDSIGDLLYFDFFDKASKGVNLTISITLFVFMILTTISAFSYLFFYKKLQRTNFSFYYFFSIIFLIFFNPFTIVTFSLIFNLSLDFEIYYLLFLIFNVFFLINFVKNLRGKVRV